MVGGRRGHQRTRPALLLHGVAEQRRRWTLENELATVFPRAGPEIHDVVCRPDRLFVVLDNDDGIAEIAQTGQCRQQRAVVTLVQPDGGLIEHVQDAGQVRTDLRCETDALAFPARQSCRASPEREISDAYVVQKVQPIANLVNHETNELFFDNLEIPAENLIGEEGRGFRYILDGLNAERTLIAAECIGDGYWFIERAVRYANERVVFDRPIGRNQGVQFPIADAYIEIEAANLMRYRACELFDAGKASGAQANMAKYLAAKASWEAANVCMQTHGGFGFANEYDIERKFRETRLYQVAPISTNLIFAYVAEHVLGLPRSF